MEDRGGLRCCVVMGVSSAASAISGLLLLARSPLLLNLLLYRGGMERVNQAPSGAGQTGIRVVRVGDKGQGGEVRKENQQPIKIVGVQAAQDNIVYLRLQFVGLDAIY